MENTRVEIAFFDNTTPNQSSAWLICNQKPVTETGLEQACFMISPNMGETLKPLSAIASGGELSRTILALKSIMAPADTDTTLIFDEVDAGIGGETAEKVGKKLADLASRHQVVCITHLAQIAKFADHHYRIIKQVEDGRTLTRIFKLDDAQRLEETARMIGGAEITRTTREHAGELLKTGRQYSPKPLH
jgi:DNA repair protein RecN (Recombination protein N)